MVTAGEDKEVHVWRRTDVGKTGWLHRRTIRWPVQRAGRGRIWSAALRGDVVAFGGEGAYAGIASTAVWPIYYTGQFLIATGVIQTLRHELPEAA